MARRESAGVLLYRFRAGELEVLLVHPGGPFWQRRDDGAWSMPKGEFTAGEDARDAARREFAEETGVTLDQPLRPLAAVRQPGGKLIHPFAACGDVDEGAIRSNTFSVEWPPKSGTLREFPEVDRAGWFGLATAKRKILAGQRPILAQLAALLDVDHPG
jgi:predicted NUDIX family NTP pyrophosphohydrolase